MLTVSFIEYNYSLHILLNSPDDNVTIELYFVSGIPKCSCSILIKDNSNSHVFLILKFRGNFK